MLTTTIGAYPKPADVPLPDWFRNQGANDPAGYARVLEEIGEAGMAKVDEAIQRVVQEQVSCGIDIPTDGEVRRENYVHYHCRHLKGFDFEALEDREIRGGAMVLTMPTLTGPVEAGAPFLIHDWQVAQAATDKPVKITVPGPMTIADTVIDKHYQDPQTLGTALADALNTEIRALAAAGCRVIQVDEPVLARKPEAALAYGIENIERCFHGVTNGVTRVVHACCGYPESLDDENYPKASPESYHTLALTLDDAAFDALSIEDAHRHNDLGLFELFTHKTVIMGVVAIARSRVESAAEIRDRLTAALDHIDGERLIAAPDCGLGFLPRDIAVAKLTNLASAAHSLP